MRYRDLRGVLASSVAVMAVAVATPAVAQVRTFNIPAQPAVTGIPALAKQADIQLLVASDAVSGKAIRAVKGRMTVDEAIRRIMVDAGLRVVNSDGRTYTLAPREMKRVRSALEAPVAMAAQEARASQYDEIIVTAQKKEERIIDVPISMSAFSEKDLDQLKIEGGSELLRSIPNVTFSKTNFASYNFSIRGIGTKALSVSSDPAVAISYNYVPLIRNRLFEQEYFDVERIEVLRGPQGTLYGRNATGGVVNMISKKPAIGDFSLSLKGEVGNYDSKRVNGHVNIPIADFLSVRFAGALTNRDGYDFNTLTNKRVNGRDLWSTRLSVAFEPSEFVRIDAVWERFKENDDRSRTGKQLCTKDPGPESFGGRDLTNLVRTRGALSQGCLPRSIFTDDAYAIPNGFTLPFVSAASGIVQVGRLPGSPPFSPSLGLIPVDSDPYDGITQSKNLREISTTLDPRFKATNDVFYLNFLLDTNSDITINLTGSYSRDNYYSFQDYNRFNSNDVFRDTSIMRNALGNPNVTTGIAVGGQLIDPQFGPSSKILAADIVKSKSDQWYFEARSASDFSGIFNYNFGLNYLKFNIDEDYYVFSNLFTAIARTVLGSGNNGAVVRDCENWTGFSDCTYVDPNPLDKINGNGHNYFRSRNKSETESKSIFGEVYFDLNDQLKLTAGLRYTHDKKLAEIYPTQLLLGTGIFGAGVVNEGYFRDPDVVQDWKKFTGRVVLDWKPDLNFSDETLVFLSYAKGYKGGGANPPRIGVNLDILDFYENEKTFKPEAVNAFELGTKNSFFNRTLDINLTSFFYDYDNYQVSQIIDRSALNENFNAIIYGAELEAKLRMVDRLNLQANLGFLKTKIKKDMYSIDVMNRTQGNDDWVLLKPWMQMASNCIAPRALVERVVSSPLTESAGMADVLAGFCPGRVGFDFTAGTYQAERYGFSYNPRTDAPNFGQGFDAPLEGNELPNSPRWTFNIAANYEVPLNGWKVVFSGDYYRQGKSWARAYNTEVDRLKSWSNINASVSLLRDSGDLEFQIYVKNILNSSPITDMHLNSDDSGLTSNVFTLDPRIIGFNTKVRF
jgi:iron complex outermembrane receptor protein